MLHPVYYILDAEALRELEQSATNSKIALRVNPLDQQAMQNLYLQLQKGTTGFSFCLCLPVLENVDEEYINNIIAFFFFPHYQQLAHAPVILLEKGDQKGFETFCNLLAVRAAKQGFNRINLVEKSLDSNNNPEYKANEKERLANDYLQALKSPTEKSFYLAVSDSVEMVAIAKFLQEVESDFAADNKAVYNMQKENKTLREKVEALQYQLSVAEQEISHMSSHMAVLGSTSQAVRLQNYYTNEYEVLPRWYKQLGHVLKVIGGKRTFNSLFDKKAKKYRT